MREARSRMFVLQTMILTAVAMAAFAANSLLCRLALRGGEIDPASFASIRLVSGAIMLALMVRLRSARSSSGRADWLAAVTLFAYVAFFSFAYLTLSAGTGALILFGAVQLTMVGVGLRSGEAFGVVAWLGLGLAIAGLVYLVSPGMAAPSVSGAASMGVAGVAWGVYSLRGRGVSDPLAATAGNFARSVPFALVLSAYSVVDTQVHAYANRAGVGLAIVSGAFTSGVGYVIWYAALSKLGAMRAATVQLSVPLIAAVGGVVLLSEPVTPRLAMASVAIVGGIAMVLVGKGRG
ncbi:DMT family transporter [Pararobbsia silviterrae]|uniref:DMT family transporter n=1 Tax=Pararobbsia silviterrae TaxID=1792498 RepID=A0A494Y7W7_9BURK|nr:DMT family transporter [Pararobbsia silviterrae]RKP56010.1 DMT family transporter [Pararobbsia silviterrae]